MYVEVTSDHISVGGLLYRNFYVTGGFIHFANLCTRGNNLLDLVLSVPYRCYYPICYHTPIDFYRAMRRLCISAVYAVMRCLSVRLSVTFVDHGKTNKHIFEIFSPSGSHTILVFRYQTGCRYFDGNPP